MCNDNIMIITLIKSYRIQTQCNILYFVRLIFFRPDFTRIMFIPMIIQNMITVISKSIYPLSNNFFRLQIYKCVDIYIIMSFKFIHNYNCNFTQKFFIPRDHSCRCRYIHQMYIYILEKKLNRLNSDCSLIIDNSY